MLHVTRTDDECNSGETMKILDVLSSRKLSKDSKNHIVNSGEKAMRSSFIAELRHKEQECYDDYADEIETLRKEIESAGGKLEQEPTIPNFKQFREILGKLVTRINAEAYRLEKCGGTPQNPRYFEIITTINLEADKLYSLIIQTQKNNMAITAKVIGIKGLIVDLMT